MLRLNDTIRLDAAERSALSHLAGMPVNPMTVAQHNALIGGLQATFAPGGAAAGQGDDSDVPECRLMNAVLAGMVLPAGQAAG